jgi:hypothetical protein
MDTIESYLNTVFAQAPDTADVRQVKAEMLANMEEKYQELKANGRSENEAVGAVISEFGNVEELFAEMGIAEDAQDAVASAGNAPDWQHLDLPQVQEIKKALRASSKGIGFGVLLILLGVAVMIGLHDIFVRLNLLASDYITVIAFFIFLVPAVGLFVFYGMKTSKYDFLERGEFYLDSGLLPLLEAESKKVQDAVTVKIVVGVVMCVGSLLVMFIVSALISDTLSVSVMLALIGVAVYLIVTGAMQRDIYSKLLRKGDYALNLVKTRETMNTLAAIYWPLAVAVYLLWSFLLNAWAISWIVWPVAGVLFAALSGLVQIIATKRSSSS